MNIKADVMEDKYDSLNKITDWIKNSSSDEFMSTFNELGDNYSGITIGEFIDSFIDNTDDDFSEYNIITTGDFIFGAEEMPSDSKNKWEMINTSLNVQIINFELVDINNIHMIDNKNKYTNLYDVAKDDIYSLAA